MIFSNISNQIPIKIHINLSGCRPFYSSEYKTYPTSIATIPITTNEPIYSKGYHYQMPSASFVSKEIENLRRDNIIRKSSQNIS